MDNANTLRLPTLECVEFDNRSTLDPHNISACRVANVAGEIVMASKNLACIGRYARRSPVAFVVSMKDPDNQCRGLLQVGFLDGCICTASFASYHIMIDWLRGRRMFRNVTHHRMHADMGYLTKPGLNVGPK